MQLLCSTGTEGWGTRHKPFGELWYGSNDEWKFTSYERDADGLDYAVFRHYNSRLGRFMQPDPYGGSVKLGLPQTWNRYTYSSNDPVNSADPLGLEDGFFWGADGCLYQSYDEMINKGDAGTEIKNHVYLVGFCGGGGGGGGTGGGGSRIGGAGGASGGGAGGEGGNGPENHCVQPTAAQRAAIAVARPVASFYGKSVFWGLGGSAGAGLGKALGAGVSASAQIAVTPNGKAGYVLTYSAPTWLLPGAGTYDTLAVSNKGANTIVGAQFGTSSAKTLDDFAGSSMNVSRSFGAGFAIAIDGSVSGSAASASVTLGFGTGGRSQGGTLTTSVVIPFCGE